MRKNRIYTAWPWYVICFFTILLSTSCISNKNVVYFSNLPDSLRIQLDKLSFPVKLVQVNDVLEISVGGENEKTVQYIHSYFAGQSVLKAAVDISGNIELPKIGKLHVAGLSKESVKDIITNAYKEYLIDPIIQVQFSNFHFAVLGEVRSPGIFDIQADKVSILEALGRAGDLTQYSERENVKIIREQNGEREVISLDMRDKAILNSANYYIQCYDVIYVAPKNIKQVNENLQRMTFYLGVVSSILALAAIITSN